MLDNDPPDEELFDLLASPRRRLLVRYLFDRNGEAHLRELSHDIVAHETDTAFEELDDSEIKRVYVSLYQTHVPALEECGVINYDGADRVVSLGDRADEVVAVLQDRDERRRRWAVYYILVGLVPGGLVLARVSGLISVPASILATVTIATAVTLLVLAVVHYRTTLGFRGHSLDDI